MIIFSPRPQMGRGYFCKTTNGFEMATAEIITIGTEILLGEILDSNARWIARQLRDIGVDLFRQTTVGDNSNRIANAVCQALEQNEIVLTTGGLGPTVDDPTREAVAQALDRELVFQPELWEQIQEQFRKFGRLPTENNRRQAYIPAGAQAIENPVGTAPCFRIEIDGKVVISLPGVPREMEYLMINSVIPWLRIRFRLTGIIKARILHTVGAGESQIDDLIGDFETLNNPTVGLAAHSGQVDVRITAKADSEEKADEMIKPVEQELRNRLVEWIYGADMESLEEAALRALKLHSWTLAVVEKGSSGSIITRLARANQEASTDLKGIFLGGEILPSLGTMDQLTEAAEVFRRTLRADVCLGACLDINSDQRAIHLVLITPNGVSKTTRLFGGHPEYTARFTAHTGLDKIRRLGNK